MRKLWQGAVGLLGGFFGSLLGGLLACTMAGAGEPTPLPTPPTPPVGPTGLPMPMPMRPRPPMGGQMGGQMETMGPMQPGVEDMTNTEYLLELARVNMKFGAAARAEELLRKAGPLAKEQRTKDDIAIDLATVLQAKQDNKGAAAQLEEVLSHPPATNAPQLGAMRSRLIAKLTDLYQQTGQTDKAEKLLSDQLALVSAKPEEAWTKTSLLQRLITIWQKEPGRIEKERTALEEASAKDPQNKDLLERLAYLYNIPAPKPDFAKLATVREKLAQLSPNDPQATMQLATAYSQNNQYDKAIEMWQKLMAVDPKGLGQAAASQIPTLLNRAGKKDEAVKWAKEHLGEQPASLANFYLQAGMIPEAEEVYAKLREQATTPEQKAQYSLDIARAAMRGRDNKKAEEEAQRVLKEFPDQKMYAGQANMILQQLKQEQAGPAVKAPPTPIQPPQPPTPAK